MPDFGFFMAHMPIEGIIRYLILPTVCAVLGLVAWATALLVGFPDRLLAEAPPDHEDEDMKASAPVSSSMAETDDTTRLTSEFWTT
ncbi:MAG: hypothetical protein LBR80_08435 [Deltaproteobacteria bacterium]|jgi:hypothetical protein|nr:hypothetical protein [Deltaproteobacteria bacterium]